MLTHPTQQFLNELPGTRDVHEAAVALARFSRLLPTPRAAFDYDLGNPGLASNDNGDPIGVEFGWPSDFVRRWVKNSLVLACPLSTPCRRFRRPFTWGLDEENLGVQGTIIPKPYTAMGQQTLSLLKEMNVSSGITVPVHHPGGRTGFVTWVSDEPLDSVQRWSESQASDLFLVAHSFLEHVESLMGMADSTRLRDCPLTERERECLTWVARGKTDGEIGIIIDRSPETARFHVRNAIAKLDASSRSHAVAKAMRRGWLGEID